MLSETYPDHSHNSALRANLFGDLAKILLALAQKPLPRIGSFTMDDEAVIRLSNRPLTWKVCQLENDNIRINMPRNRTYTTVDSYIHGVLSFHDDRLRYLPNAVKNMADGAGQMSVICTMRSLCWEYFDRNLRNGPFVFTLTDMHPSNLLVDENWNITCVLDLEWACVLPIEMQQPPHWLTSQAVDGIDEHEYGELSNEFIDRIQREETEMTEPQQKIPYAELLKKVMGEWDVVVLLRPRQPNWSLQPPLETHQAPIPDSK